MRISLATGWSKSHRFEDRLILEKVAAGKASFVGEVDDKRSVSNECPVFPLQ